MVRGVDSETVHSYGWIAIDGAALYQSKTLSSQQKRALTEYDGKLKIRDSAVDRFCTPVELLFTSGGIFRMPIFYTVDRSANVQTGMALPAELSGALVSTLQVSAGRALPIGCRANMRDWRAFRCAALGPEAMSMLETSTTPFGIFVCYKYASNIHSNINFERRFSKRFETGRRSNIGQASQQRPF